MSDLFSLDFEQRGNYLYAHLASESISVEVIEGYTREIARKMDEIGATHVLLYRDIPNSLPVNEVYQTVIESLDRLRGKKLAIVNPYADIEKDLEFGVVVGKNRGGNYDIFQTVDDAEAWLNAG